MQGDIEQVVFVQEAVEDLGGQHQRRRHADANAGIAASDSPLMQQVAYKSESACLSAQRTAADLEEERFRWLEGRGVEFADQDLALLAAILSDGVDQVAAQFLGVGEIGDLTRPQLLRQREFRARHQPMRKVVSRSVIGDAFCRHRRQLRLQLIQVRGPRHFGLVSQAKDEVAETDLLDQDVAQV